MATLSFPGQVPKEEFLVELRNALTDGVWSIKDDQITDKNYFAVQAGEDIDGLYCEINNDTFTIKHGLNWENPFDNFVHPNPTPDNCEDATHPGELWSDQTTIVSDVGSVVRGPGWFSWHGRSGGNDIRIATEIVDKSESYLTFGETVTCDCNGVDDPVNECSSDSDTYTKDVTGYNSIGRVAIAIRGGDFNETWGTITGDRTGDIRTTPYSARLGENEYARDQQWELEQNDGSLAGTHKAWILSDDSPVNLSDRGTFQAGNETYTSPLPAIDDAVYKIS